MDFSIPRLLFQTWKTSTPPRSLQQFQQTWKNHHPHWNYVLTTDSENQTFVQNLFPEFFYTYMSLPHNIQRVDMIRYMWLYYHGGIYADLDMQCLKSLEPLLLQYEKSRHLVILGEENEIHHDGTKRVGNAIMISTRQHPFWLQVLQEIVKRTSGYKKLDTNVTVAWTTTGPHMLHDVYQQWKQLDEILVLPSATFYPLKWQATPQLKLVKKKDYPLSFTIHHWAGSWWIPPHRKTAPHSHILGISLACLVLVTIIIVVLLMLKSPFSPSKNKLSLS